LGILYFGFICDGPCPLDVAVSFQGVTVAGILLATAPQPCWAGETYGAYSADVTPWLSSPINDDYRVEGVPSGRTDGSDPWFSELTLPLAEGASLVVVYAQSNLVPGVVYINEGAVMFSGTVTIDNPVSPPLTERAGAS
jgi:hypothetical protein